MRVLQITKTSEASFWAVRHAAHLKKEGIDVHAVLPSSTGAAVNAWRNTGATLHFLDCSLPVRSPSLAFQRASRIKRLVESIRPDLIHTHHVTTTLMLRLSLGTAHPVPRLFHVPGPLHLEHWHTRNFELALSGEGDFWIASSRYILRLYEQCGLPASRLFLSYYPTDTASFSAVRTGFLRKKLGIPEHALIVGNINLIYPPKKYLGQMVGLKCHEDVIEAIRIVQQKRSDVWGVLPGATFGNSERYEQKLKQLARQKGNGKILMPGKFSAQEVARSWPDFDCAVHVPLSENCGGVVEPLLSGVPTVAGNVGGLPEVVRPGLTGELVPTRKPKLLADAVLNALDRRDEFRQMAKHGRQLTKVMFDVTRCSNEVLSIYRHLLFKAPRPVPFQSEQFEFANSPCPAVGSSVQTLSLTASTSR
ncbi:MAG: glycosyltransferase family 4 protein [Candidatus Sulfotelmatobacter sp.]|jgi:glycosyltransferase involved in cell wall biosynthesis